MELLQVKGLYKSYKKFKLQDISFTLPKGYIMGYVGKNGAGKTTTLNLITHLCHAEAGQITLNGLSYDEKPNLYKEMIGYVGDESYFPQELKVKDIGGILKNFYPTFRNERWNELLKQWQLPTNQKVKEYSRGMKVKLMFAAALSRDTKLLILDEATNGLDPVVRSEILKLLQEYIEDGEKSILFSTHILNDLEQIADYIILIDEGRIILQDTKDELLESYVLIKGDSKELPDNLKQHLMGVEYGEYGCSAILSTEYVEQIPRSFVIDQPTIDQIMVANIKRGRNVK